MDQDKQTLLEAAKAALFGARFDCGGVYLNLRDAIARAESETMDFHKTNLPHIDRARKAEDRAQQAEADAAWHRAESERLSAELAMARKSLDFYRDQIDRIRDELHAVPDKPAVRAAKDLMKRAEKAEADAAWRKAEGERLSAELALAKNQMTLAIERSERLSGQLRGCEYDLGQAGKLRQRAEKAEADVRLLRDALASAHSLPADTPTKDLIAKLWEGINGNAEQLSRTGHELPLKVSKVLPQVVDELLRLRAELEERREDGVVTAQDVCDLRARAMRAEGELAKAKSDTRAKLQSELRSIERALCSADVLIKFAALPRGCYEGHVHNTIETAISALRDDAATPPYSPPFEGDPKACAFKSHAQFYGESPYQTAKDASEAVDPCTGWTFATYRRVVEALGGKS